MNALKIAQPQCNVVTPGILISMERPAAGQLQEVTPTRYCGCVTDLSVPATGRGEPADDVSLIFDQAFTPVEVPEVPHEIIDGAVILVIESRMQHACASEAVLEETTVQRWVSEDELEAVGYLGWACRGRF